VKTIGERGGLCSLSILSPPVVLKKNRRRGRRLGKKSPPQEKKTWLNALSFSMIFLKTVTRSLKEKTKPGKETTTAVQIKSLEKTAGGVVEERGEHPEGLGDLNLGNFTKKKGKERRTWPHRVVEGEFTERGGYMKHSRSEKS